MKILSILLMAVMMIAISATFVLAEDNATAVPYGDDGLLTSDNSTDVMPILISENPAADVSQETEAELELNESVSTGEIAWKQMGLWFTFNQEKIIEKQLELARLRLAQANRAAKNNNSEAMEKAMEAHDRIMQKVQERMGKLEAGADARGLNDSTTKLLGLERAIQVHEQRITFLSNVLENANLTDEQRARIESKIAQAQNVTEKLNELSLEKKDKIKTRLMAVGNLTEEQVEEIMEIMKPKLEDKPRLMQKINEQARERDKQFLEQVRERDKQAREQTREANKQTREQAREQMGSSVESAKDSNESDSDASNESEVEDESEDSEESNATA